MRRVVSVRRRLLRDQTLLAEWAPAYLAHGQHMLSFLQTLVIQKRAATEYDMCSLDLWQFELLVAEKQTLRQDRADNSSDWHQFVQLAYKSGARIAHQATKVRVSPPVEFASGNDDSEGLPSSLPHHILYEQRDVWWTLWGGGGGGGHGATLI